MELVYHCPGEPQPVSRSVHLARIAAGYDACRHCPQRDQTGSLPRRIARHPRHSSQRTPADWISSEGIRGVYLNELTRERMARLAGHILNLAQAEQLASHASPERGRGRLRVLVGQDVRSSSPDLSIGIVATLRQWGCDTADLARVSRGCFDFAMRRLRPDLGLYVTGGLHPSNWNGLDVIGPDGAEWRHPGELTRLAERSEDEPARIRRTQGMYQPVSIHEEYEAALTEQLHAIRPLRLAIACADPLTLATLHTLLERTPCSVWFVAARTSPDAEAGRQLADAMRERHADAGFFIGSDGRTCLLVDERGEPFSIAQTVQLLTTALNEDPLGAMEEPSGGAELVTAEPVEWERHHGNAVVRRAGRRQPPDRTGNDCPMRTTTLSSERRPTDSSSRQEQETAHAAALPARYRFRAGSPGCDAVLTVARSLQAFSLTPGPVSDCRAAVSRVG
jgi:hypothetical protein